MARVRGQRYGERMTKNFYNPTPVGAAHPPVSPVHQPARAEFPHRQPAHETIELAEGEDVPSAQDIAQRAYELYVKQGSRAGHDIEHWLEAEKQLRNEYHHLQNRSAAQQTKK